FTQLQLYCGHYYLEAIGREDAPGGATERQESLQGKFLCSAPPLALDASALAYPVPQQPSLKRMRSLCFCSHQWSSKLKLCKHFLQLNINNLFFSLSL